MQITLAKASHSTYISEVSFWSFYVYTVYDKPDDGA